MKVVLCIKPVRSDLVYSNEKRNEQYAINPYDLKALKDLVRLKEKADCHISCVCMGAMASEVALIKAIALGADEAILLNDNAFIGSDTVATTFILAKAIEKIGDVDLVVCGEKSVDGETGQVSFGISERLQLMSYAGIDTILEVGEGTIVLKAKSEDMIKTMRVSYPAVLTYKDFDLEIGNMSLLALKKAKRKGVTVWKAADMNLDPEQCGDKGSKTKVSNIQYELIKKQSEMIQGETFDKASAILSLLSHRKIGSV